MTSRERGERSRALKLARTQVPERLLDEDIRRRQQFIARLADARGS